MVEITLKTDTEKQYNSEVDWIFFSKACLVTKAPGNPSALLKSRHKIQFINKSSVKASFLKSSDLASA